MDRADVRVLPPVILLGALALGLVSRAVLPGARLPRRGWRWLGLASIALAVALVASAVREMRRARTSLDVRKPTGALVSGGAFGVSRNPIYLSMVLLYLGVSLLLDSLPMVLLAGPLGTVLYRAAIEPEERYLEEKFGATYRSYKATVRRWI